MSTDSHISAAPIRGQSAKGRKRMKVFQVQFYEGSNTYIDGSIENVLAAIAVEMKENEVDTKITITTKEMSQTEIDALPEWDGP